MMSARLRLSILVFVITSILVASTTLAQTKESDCLVNKYIVIQNGNTNEVCFDVLVQPDTEMICKMVLMTKDFVNAITLNVYKRHLEVMHGDMMNSNDISIEHSMNYWSPKWFRMKLSLGNTITLSNGMDRWEHDTALHYDINEVHISVGLFTINCSEGNPKWVIQSEFQRIWQLYTGKEFDIELVSNESYVPEFKIGFSTLVARNISNKIEAQETVLENQDLFISGNHKFSLRFVCFEDVTINAPMMIVVHEEQVIFTDFMTEHAMDLWVRSANGTTFTLTQQRTMTQQHVDDKPKELLTQQGIGRNMILLSVLSALTVALVVVAIIAGVSMLYLQHYLNINARWDDLWLRM